jgi:hypothetical protein
MSRHDDAQGAIPPEPNASEQPHDVLAAEQFAIPAPDAAWHPGPVQLPPEPNPSDEPHDVLAAEEFAMPAPPPHVAFASAPAAPKRPAPRRLAAAATGLGMALAAILHRRRRRDRG